MKTKNSKIIIIFGSVPYIFLWIYSIVSIFYGANSCYLEQNQDICKTIYGFKATGHIWYKTLLNFYPIFLLLLILIIIGYTKQKKINKTRTKILYGVSPIILSIIIYINALLAKTENSTSSIFSMIFFNNRIILISEIIGIIYLCTTTLKQKNKKA